MFIDSTYDILFHFFFPFYLRHSLSFFFFLRQKFFLEGENLQNPHFYIHMHKFRKMFFPPTSSTFVRCVKFICVNTMVSLFNWYSWTQNRLKRRKITRDSETALAVLGKIEKRWGEKYLLGSSIWFLFLTIRQLYQLFVFTSFSSSSTGLPTKTTMRIL